MLKLFYKYLQFSFEDVFNSWGNRRVKMHFSSPKNKRDYRSHNEYINGDDFINFIEILKKYDRDIDIMLEAKGKDDSLFRLVRYIKYKTDYAFIDDTTFLV
jgi:UV DNA damage endonuclease